MSHLVKIEESLYVRLKAMAESERRSVASQLATLLDASTPKPKPPEAPPAPELPPERESMLIKYRREHPDEFPASGSSVFGARK